MTGPAFDRREERHRIQRLADSHGLRPSVLFADHDELRGGSRRVELTATIAGRSLSFTSSDEAEAFARAIANVAAALKGMGQ